MDNLKTNQEPTVETPIINQELPLQATEESEPQLPQQPELTPEPPIETEPEMEKTAPSNDYQQVLNEYATNTQKPPVIDTPPKSPEEQLQDLGISTQPKTDGFFKFLFTLALIVFIFIVAILGFVYFKNKTQKQTIDTSNPSSFDTAKVTPSLTSNDCSLNDKNYIVGDNFYATDGCNICTCESKDTITCTEKVCDPTAVPTKSATDSSAKKLVPTATQSATQN